MSMYHLYESLCTFNHFYSFVSHVVFPLLSIPQNDLKVLFTSLADNKYITLQKLANVFERPIVEQIQVCTTVLDIGMYK